MVVAYAGLAWGVELGTRSSVSKSAATDATPGETILSCVFGSLTLHVLEASMTPGY